MKIFKAGILYFALVFAAGFILGPIRILWLVPKLGSRMAELLEMPIMLIVIIFSAQWIIRRFTLPYNYAHRLGMGCIAFLLLLSAEFTFVLSLQGLSINEYLASRDIVSGTVYYMMLGVFAIMPICLARNIASGD